MKRAVRDTEGIGSRGEREQLVYGCKPARRSSLMGTPRLRPPTASCLSTAHLVSDAWGGSGHGLTVAWADIT
eukprot:1115771-Rhodomonas_salina.3